MRQFMSLRNVATLSAAAVLMAAANARFPDVPLGHLFNEPIEQLVIAGVINGNPDGNFYPDRNVNRAEMLKMLYTAKGKTPDPTNVRCFPDVAPGSWYESYVCDAAANRYVGGYSDGMFRPAQEVNRVEALKMIATVFEIPVYELSDEDKDVINFADVSPSAWYAKYLFVSYDTGILPIAGQDYSRFHPDIPLKRGESAAYIYNALQAELRISREDGSQKDEEDTDDAGDTGSTADDTKEDEEEETEVNELEVDFPFSGGGKFNGKKPFVYRFWIHEDTTVLTDVSLQSGQPGEVSCTLFLLEEDGMSQEYYLGTKEGRHCYLLTTLTPGYYQLQLQPTVADTTYNVTSDITTNGDGNDGFSEAIPVSLNTSRTFTMKPNNFQDWYSFSVDKTEGQRMMVELTNKKNLDCVVYAMADVDLYGFAGPQCNQFYTYPMGTYFISVGRDATKSSRQTYTVRLKE